jgi:hypothetical protein
MAAAPPSVQRTPMASDVSTTSAPTRSCVAIKTTTTTAPNEATVASGPSRSIERIISAKIVARLAVSTFVPSGKTTLSVARAILSKLWPFDRTTSFRYLT